jgi:glycosyltransferase involved in cell wall biosynthesis
LAPERKGGNCAGLNNFILDAARDESDYCYDFRHFTKAASYDVSDANLRQIRVLHIVSAGALASSLQQSLFMPLLTRLPRPRVKSLVACLSPGAVPSAVLRQSGVPTYDLALSRKRFSPRAFQELHAATRNFRPDVIQAWGHTAQIISSMLRARCDWKPRLIWNVADTAPLAKDAGLIDRQKLKYAAKYSSRADRIVYSSEAAAAAHRRVGFPEGEHEMIPPGVDATRFKPDFAARRKLREQWNLPGETFVIGMYAPFQPEYDYSTLIKGVAEVIKSNPNVALVLAGHGVQKGNAPLMALIGGGALSTRVHLLGEWSDTSALYNACDVVCSSALNDQSRMNVVMAMLCGVPCVATGMGAQGEVIGQHGVAVEPGNPGAFVKGITRVMQMTQEKRTFMAQGARKHALANYVYVRSLQKYLQLYYELIGRQSLVTQDLPTPDVDPTLTVPPALPTEAELNASKRKPVTVADWSDPDSLESKVTEREPEELPKWRIEQEQERTKREAELAAQVAASKTNGDVLQVFEIQHASAPVVTPMTERARGVADDSEELLSADLLTAEVPILPRAALGPSSSKKSAKASLASSGVQPDAAKEAALKAARMAALQPITPPAKRPSSAAKPVAAVKAAAAVIAPIALDQVSDFNSTTPVLLAASELLQTSPAPAKVDIAATQRVETLIRPALKAEVAAPVKEEAVAKAPSAAPLPVHESAAPFELLPETALSTPIGAAAKAITTPPAPEKAAESSISSTGRSAKPLTSETAAVAASAAPEKATERAASMGREGKIESPAAARAAQVATQRPQVELSLAPEVTATAQQAEPTASPLGRLAKALASASAPHTSAASEPARAELKPSFGNIQTPSRPAASMSDTQRVATSSFASRAGAARAATGDAKSPATATSSMTAALEKWNSSFDLGELSLMATGVWTAAPRSGATAKLETKSPSAEELSGAEALSLISEPSEQTIASTDPTLKLETLPEPTTEPKLAANAQ